MNKIDYPARRAYQNKEVVWNYEKLRFSNFKGQIVDKMEKYLIMKAIKYAKIFPPATILDIPCGTGRLSIYLAQKGFNIRAIDTSQEMVNYTNKKTEILGLADKINATIGDAEALNYPDNTFDACISLRLFGHTPPEVRKTIIKELERVSKKYLILVYYHKNSLQNFLRRKKRKTKSTLVSCDI